MRKREAMSRRTFDELVSLIAKLRGEDGCPWDRAQDHVSLRRFVVEEAHEVVAAIDAEAWDALADELGDLLLQVLLHSRIAAEHERFTIDDVLEGLAAKLVRRHPHVFADAPGDLDSIRQSWRDVKRAENRRPIRLPTLLTAHKKVEEIRASGRSIAELAVAGGETNEEGRAGWILLEAIAMVLEMGQDPELALRQAMRGLDSGRDEAEGHNRCSTHSSTG
ncbi:hypothetical protein JW848_07940 [Candidatus Bipolaricaulota bacterium]|nr:hypothetical protein [Candidatus Bipolaricaulota bacterium]